MVKKDTTWEIELKNNVVIKIMTCSYRGIRGYTLIGAICEEISFWRDEFSANPATEILRAVRPGMVRIPNSLLIAISTPYSPSGLLFEMYSEFFGTTGDDSPLIFKCDSRTMNPTIPRSEIAKEFRRDATAARSEFDAEFREDLENFLPMELISSAIVPGRIELLPMKNVRYHGFCDPSGGRSDSMTLAICHQDKTRGKIIVDLVKEVVPPFTPSVVVKDFSNSLKSFGISFLKADAYAGEWVSESFANHGIMVENSELTKSQIYLAILPLMANQRIEIPEDRRLISQLRSLERRCGRGRDVVDHPPGLKDDLSNAVGGAIAFCSKSGVENNLSEIHTAMAQSENEYLNPEEKESARITNWLLGAPLEPPSYAQEKKESEQRKPCLTISEWIRQTPVTRRKI